MNIKKSEIKNDIIDMIKVFDMFLDNMYDRGAYNPEDNNGEIEKYITTMKNKYLKEI